MNEKGVFSYDFMVLKPFQKSKSKILLDFFQGKRNSAFQSIEIEQVGRANFKLLEKMSVSFYGPIKTA